MGRIRQTVALGVVVMCLSGTSVAAQVLPPPPTLPPQTLPDSLAPVIAVTGPTAGAACGTASLLALLTPSLAEGYFDIPLSSLIDSQTFRSYGNTALYICGFVPFPLTPSQCDVDRAIVDALRGLNPLAAQAVGLFPQGATVDTVLALEQLLPTGPSVAGPLVEELSALMACSRSSGPPPTPPSEDVTEMPPLDAVPPAVPEVLPVPADAAVVTGPVVTPPAPPVAEAKPSNIALPQVFETRFVPRTGVQWLGVVLGVVLLAFSLVGWLLGRRRLQTDTI